MKMFLNFNGIYKSGTYATVAAEIHDEVEIALPEGFKEVTMQDESKAIEWPDGQMVKSRWLARFLLSIKAKLQCPTSLIVAAMLLEIYILKL